MRGSKLFDLETDSQHGKRIWEAKVADQAGRQFDLELSADGRQVTGKREDKSPDDDVAKLRSATVPARRAISTADARARGKGNLSALEIDTAEDAVKKRAVIWQVSFGGDAGTTVIVDAKAGDVLDVGRDAG